MLISFLLSLFSICFSHPIGSVLIGPLVNNIVPCPFIYEGAHPFVPKPGFLERFVFRF